MCPQSPAATSIKCVSQQNSPSGWTRLSSRMRGRFHPGASHQPSTTRRSARLTEPNRFNLKQEKKNWKKRQRSHICKTGKTGLEQSGRPSGTATTLTWHHVTQKTHMTETIAELNDSCNTSTPLSQSPSLSCAPAGVEISQFSTSRQNWRSLLEERPNVFKKSGANPVAPPLTQQKFHWIESCEACCTRVKMAAGITLPPTYDSKCSCMFSYYLQEWFWIVSVDYSQLCLSE